MSLGSPSGAGLRARCSSIKGYLVYATLSNWVRSAETARGLSSLPANPGRTTREHPFHQLTTDNGPLDYCGLASVRSAVGGNCASHVANRGDRAFLVRPFDVTAIDGTTEPPSLILWPAPHAMGLGASRASRASQRYQTASYGASFLWPCVTACVTATARRAVAGALGSIRCGMRRAVGGQWVIEPWPVRDCSDDNGRLTTDN